MNPYLSHRHDEHETILQINQTFLHGWLLRGVLWGRRERLLGIPSIGSVGRSLPNRRELRLLGRRVLPIWLLWLRRRLMGLLGLICLLCRLWLLRLLRLGQLSRD